MQEIVIGIAKLKVSCIIGCNPKERTKKQNIIFDIKVKTNWENKNDDIATTVSYVEIAEIVKNVSKEGEYFILESLVSDLSKVLFKQYPSIFHLCIKVTKPKIIPNCEGCFVEYERSR